MLDKSSGNFLVEKLRVILLFEADFKTIHKIHFNGRLMPSLDSSANIPCKIIGGIMSQAANHLALSKKLIADISNARKLPTATMCVDAANCYAIVAHQYASLCAQCFGMDIKYLQVIFNHTEYEDAPTHSFWGLHFLLC